MPLTELHDLVRGLAEEFTRQRVWRKAAAEPGAAVELVDTALHKLTALRLVRHTPGEPDVTALPAIARYGVAAPTITEPGGSR